MHPIQQKLIELAKVRDLSKLSIREIGRQIADGGSNERVHPQQVKYHLQRLTEAGLINVASRATAQKIKPSTEKAPTFVSIPVLGSANCGPATFFAEEQISGHLRISTSLLKSRNYQNLFAIQASGRSMNRARIYGTQIDDGDYVIADHSKITPRSGEYVVVVDDDKANIKKLFLDYDNHQVVLFSESSENYDPIFIDPADKWDSLINGTVVQVVKRPRFD